MDPEQAAYSVMLEVVDILKPECDDLIIVGGWVPDLHYPDEQHVGSLDVDLVVRPKNQDSTRNDNGCGMSPREKSETCVPNCRHIGTVPGR